MLLEQGAVEESEMKAPFMSPGIVRRLPIFAAIFALLTTVSVVVAQEHPIQGHLDSGEFNRAIELANSLDDTQQADYWRARIANAQKENDAVMGAFATLATIQDNQFRYDAFNTYASNRDYTAESAAEESAAGTNRPAGNQGVG